MLKNGIVYLIVSLFCTHGVFATKPYASPASTDYSSSGGSSGYAASPQSVNTLQGEGGSSATPASTDYINENEVYTIGQLAQGGVIFYLDSTKKHGLVCSLKNISTSLTWAPSYDNCGANQDGIGAGAYNTQQIIATGGGSYTSSNCAAVACDALRDGGYSDWYLPSLDELNQLYLQKTTVNSACTRAGGDMLLGAVYWSSLEGSEDPADFAWVEAFSNGYQDYDYKDDVPAVRAVRAF